MSENEDRVDSLTLTVDGCEVTVHGSGESIVLLNKQLEARDLYQRSVEAQESQVQAHQTAINAFASWIEMSKGLPQPQEGPTVRDLYAMAALQGICGHMSGPEKRAGETTQDAHARWAFAVADSAMKMRVSSKG